MRKTGENDFREKSALIGHLPHYSTLQKKFKQAVCKLLAPRGQDFDKTIGYKTAGVRCKSLTTDGEPKAPVRVILPMEYAREDIATPQVLQEICNNSLQGLRDIQQVSETTMQSDDF